MYNSFFVREDQWSIFVDPAAVGDFDAKDAKSEDFGPRTVRFVHRLVDPETGGMWAAEEFRQVHEQYQQMLFSSMVILLKFLKTNRLQDTLGEKP